MNNILLLVFLIFALNGSAQLPTNLPAAGLVAWYPFNGNTNDESGFANNALLGSGNSLTFDRHGIANSAYNFSGSTQMIIPPSFYTPFDSSFTISLWFNSTFTGREQPFNINDNNLFVSNLNFAFNNAGGNFVFWNSQGTNYIVSGNLSEYTDGFWHNMIFLRADRASVLFYTLNYNLNPPAVAFAVFGFRDVLFLAR